MKLMLVFKKKTRGMCKVDIGTCNEPLTAYDFAQRREASALTTAPH